jgi:type II secretory pathway component PulM
MWLVGPMLLAGFGLASLALSGGGRGWLATIRGGASVLLELPPVPWFLAAPLRRGSPRRRIGPVLAGGVLAVLLVVVFGVLFASADAVFSQLLSSLTSDIGPGWPSAVLVRVFLFAVFGALVASGVLVALRPVNEPTLPDLRIRAKRPLWLIPLGTLNVLVAVFVAVQITVLFGGDRRVLETAGLTYAEYARSGFFELVTVSVFVLAIVAVACGALKVTGRDRWLLTALLGLLCALTLVILASALHRLDLYLDAYGLSRLRALVFAAIWWLGAVFVLVLVAGGLWLANRRTTWLPRTLVLLTGLAMVAFAAWNPDLRVAESQQGINNGDRALDHAYLADLGPEAVPALDRLPEPTRSCLLTAVVRYSGLDAPESWITWNLARAQARDVIARHPLVPAPDCVYSRN